MTYDRQRVIVNTLNRLETRIELFTPENIDEKIKDIETVQVLKKSVVLDFHPKDKELNEGFLDLIEWRKDKKARELYIETVEKLYKEFKVSRNETTI